MRDEFFQGFEKRAAGVSSLKPEELRGLLSNTIRRGNDSIMSLPLSYLSKKLFGQHKTVKGMKVINKHILNADMHAGSAAHSLAKHIPGLRKAFLKKEKVPVNIGKKIYHEIETPSLLAPVEKVNRVATPLIATLAVGNYLDKRKNGSQGTTENSLS